jgi:hypothetical protein
VVPAKRSNCSTRDARFLIVQTCEGFVSFRPTTLLLGSCHGVPFPMRTCAFRVTWPVLLFALAACENVATSFDETTFAAIRSSGSAAIAGRAVGYMGDQHWEPMQTRVAHHLTVGLMPANAYTDEVARIIWQNAPTEVVLDPRLTQFVRKTITDGDGNFSFGHSGLAVITCSAVSPGLAAKMCSITLMTM